MDEIIIAVDISRIVREWYGDYSPLDVSRGLVISMAINGKFTIRDATGKVFEVAVKEVTDSSKEELQ